MSFKAIREALKTAKKIKKTIDAELKEGLIPTPKEAKGKNVQNTTQAKARSKKLGTDIKEMEGILKGPDSKAATQKGLRFAKKYNLQEGMGLDAITGGSIRAAVDVDKGKAGKVTRSPEPGFLQLQRTEGGRKRADRRVKAEEKARAGDKAAKKTVERMERKDEADKMSAVAKASATRRGRKKEVDDFAVAINRKTGVINEASFNRLTKNQQDALIRDINARFEGPQLRRIKAQIDELRAKEGRTKAGDESGVGARSGGPRGMRGATERNIKDIDEGVGGRGGLDFRKGGAVKKKAIGATDYRMNKGGLLLSSVDNRKRK
tara:strand:+ start:594 stop:1553 length:960 start_codon:yes stop_codon:yes gene_type:complete